MGTEPEESEKLSAWMESQNLRHIRKLDNKSKSHIVTDFSFILSRGIYAKQHVVGDANAFQIHLRLDPTSTKLTWVGGVESSYSSSRSINISDISLVSTGIGTATFNQCSSADLAKPDNCLSLVLPRSLFFDEAQSLDLEFSNPEECEALAFGFSLIIADGSQAKYFGATSAEPWTQLVGMFI
mmetsp:Transcript_5604/g.6961  ORF Transcript_5604/g.6961 Transcript_5604/m.6961 type:complete len:183 (+) Transcript_5604:32-580(+)